MRTRRRADRGSAMVFAAALAVVLVMAAAAAVIVAAVMLATHRARNAADLAALAGATAVISGGDGCSAAKDSARTNGAAVKTCDVSGDTSSFVVAVTVTAPTGLKAPLPATVGAGAHAGNAGE